MNHGPDPAVVLSTQRHLRADLLDRASTLPWAPARDLAAHLLLSVDDPGACWSMGVRWLRDRFDVDRVEGGACQDEDGLYSLGAAQACRENELVPSVRGLRVPMRSAVLRVLSGLSGPLVLEEISQASVLEHGLRTALIDVGTQVKIASSLHFEGVTFGFLCMDHVLRAPRITTLQHDHFQLVTGVVLGRILGASHRLAQSGPSVDGPLPEELLTPAERRVLALLASGLGYKRIAQHLGRSVHTVDHQLRSIRTKLKVRTNMQLIGLLSGTRAPDSTTGTRWRN